MGAPSISMFQICRVDLQVEEFDKRSVELLPDKMDLMTDTELTQYFMKTWILDFNDPGEYTMHDETSTSRILPMSGTIEVWVPSGMVCII